MIVQKRKYIGIFPHETSAFIFSQYLFAERQLLYLVEENSAVKRWIIKFLAIHGFPKPDSAIYCPLNKPLPISGLSVFQHPNSWGGEKTYYIRRTNELDTLLKTGEIRRKKISCS